MTTEERFVLEGGYGCSQKLAAGECLKIVNTEGSQVVDLWAFSQDNSDEFLSTEHTRSCLQKLIPGVGDLLYSNQRRAILAITEDTSPGIHDMLLSACDEQRYALLGHVGYHRNCADNLREAMSEAGYTCQEIPSPLNVFERVEIDDDGGLSIQPPLVEAGQSITFKAEIDLLLVLSTCPMDIALTNGPDKRAKPVEVIKLG